MSAFFIAAPLLLFSQDETGIPKLKPSGTYWGIGYYANGNVSVGNDYVKSGSGVPGWGGSIEITYFDGKTEMLMNISKSKTGIQGIPSYYETFELTIGPRFKLDNSGSYFAEVTAGGIGYRKIRNRYYEYWDDYYYDIYNDDMDFDFGITAGFGLKYTLNKNTALLFKTRLITSLPVNSNSMITYITASTGIVFNNRETKEQKVQRAKSYFGAAVYAGLSSCNPLVKDNYTWSPGYGLEFNYKISPLAEILLHGNYTGVKYLYDNNKSRTEMLYLLAGLRFYLNNTGAAAFIETGVGVYEFSNESAGDGIERMPGVNFATGAKIKIYNFMDFIIKGSLNLLLNERYSPAPDMFTLLGGVRYNF